MHVATADGFKHACPAPDWQLKDACAEPCIQACMGSGVATACMTSPYPPERELFLGSAAVHCCKMRTAVTVHRCMRVHQVVAYACLLPGRSACSRMCSLEMYSTDRRAQVYLVGSITTLYMKWMPQCIPLSTRPANLLAASLADTHLLWDE